MSKQSNFSFSFHLCFKAIFLTAAEEKNEPYLKNYITQIVNYQNLDILNRDLLIKQNLS